MSTALTQKSPKSIIREQNPSVLPNLLDKHHFTLNPFLSPFVSLRLIHSLPLRFTRTYLSELCYSISPVCLQREELLKESLCRWQSHNPIHRRRQLLQQRYRHAVIITALLWWHHQGYSLRSFKAIQQKYDYLRLAGRGFKCTARGIMGAYVLMLNSRFRASTCTERITMVTVLT